ncbi:histidinol-phosphatase [Barnesiella viscericola]|uniref:histidinol-phosphatase n=1 Tax=Barnesiella viscericola TaxID=397865 RepID=UPI0025A38146|nr:histidinol-phosphatase [Barnesiella viscericola]MDM8269751.1 histidinol-phosphatase [Barnesiella viscericola]
MNLLTNYHSHCEFCDGHAPMADFVEEAVAEGFASYGISSHAPFPVANNCNMHRERLADYLDEFHRLKSLYASKIELYVGLEIDFLDDTFNPSIPYFQELPLDYRIGSVHYIVTPDGTPIDTDGSPDRFRGYVDTYFGGDVDEAVRRFYRSSFRLIELGGFDFLGHLDKIGLNASLYRPGLDREAWYRQLVNDYLEAIASRHLLVEVNTKAFATRGRFFPNEDYFEQMHRLGIRVVVNSDAHYPAKINAGRPEALHALARAGYTAVWQLSRGEWVEAPLDL